MHEIINLRTASPVIFGDKDSEQAYERMIAETVAKQQFEYAVAPGQRVFAPSGKTFEAGEEVKLTDLHDPLGPGPAVTMDKLVMRGIVLEASHRRVCPLPARYTEGAR